MKTFTKYHENGQKDFAISMAGCWMVTIQEDFPEGVLHILNLENEQG